METGGIVILDVFRAGEIPEALMMLDRTHPQGLWATNPYAIAHELVRLALQED